MAVKPMKPENRINLIAELNERFEEVEGGGGGSTVTAGKGIAVSYGEVSVDKGDGLKFDENKLSVDRDALEIPEPVYAGIATVLTASGNMNVLFDDNTIKVNSKGQLYANVSGGGGTVAAGDGITVSDNTVSVNKGDYLKFTDGALEVDRDALNIPKAVTIQAGEGIAVNGNAVAVDKGNGLKFVDNRLEVDRDALNIPEAVSAGVATEIASTGAVNVLYDDDTIKVNSAGKLYANVSGGGGGGIQSVTASEPLAATTESGAVSLELKHDNTLNLSDSNELSVNSSYVVAPPSAQGCSRNATVKGAINGMSVTARVGVNMVMVSAAPPADTGLIPEGTAITIGGLPARLYTSSSFMVYGAAFKATDTGVTFSDIKVEEVNVSDGSGRGYKVTNVNECNGYNIVIPIFI